MAGKTNARIKAVIVPPVIAQVRVEGTTVHRAPAYASRRVVHGGDCFNKAVMIKDSPEKIHPSPECVRARTDSSEGGGLV